MENQEPVIDNGPRFDTRISLPWLISTAIGLLTGFAGLIWSVSLQSNKIDTLLTQQSKIEARLDNRDIRLDTMMSSFTASINAIQREDDKQDFRLDAIERAMQSKVPRRD